MKKRFIVHMAVDGRIDLEVEAENPEAAYIEAVDAFENANLSKMEVISARPIHCEDDTGFIVKDY